jgi:hypothetical protein
MMLTLCGGKGLVPVFGQRLESRIFQAAAANQF